jgi:hypothetical protein
VSALQETVAKAMSGALQDWIACRDYGLLVLVERDETASQIRKAIVKANLNAEALIIVDIAPRTSTFSQYLKPRKKKESRS